MFVAAVTTDVSRVTEFLDYMAVFPACDAIGYVVDFEGAGTQFQSLYDIAIANAKNPTQLDQTLRNDWEIKFQKLTGLLARVRAQGADTAAEIIFIDSLINQYGAKCEAYAKKVEYSPYIKPGPFQLSKGRKDAVGLILARAEAGEVTYMAIAADLYGSGKVNGQEDAVNDSSWTERAANAGDSASADITSLAYYVGYGVTKNYTTSTKWGRIAIALGCQCDADVAEREKTMTTEEIADGKAAADQWLTDHK